MTKTKFSDGIEKEVLHPALNGWSFFDSKLLCFNFSRSRIFEAGKDMKRNNIEKIIKITASASKHLTADFLFEIGEAVEAVPKIKSLTIACSPFPLERIAEIEEAKERKRIRETIKRLEKKRFLKIRKKAGQIEAVLTHSGLCAVLQETIRRCETKLPDGQLVIVSFDIPEAAKKIREKWRYLLRGFGFQLLHKSVWVSNRDVGILLAKLIKLLRADKWILVFSGRCEV